MFRFKVPRKRRLAVPALRISKPLEGLTGIVQGWPATDIEERMYIAFLHNAVLPDDIEFQPSYLAGRSMLGEIRPDFALHIGLIQIWYADEDFFHRTAEQANRDAFNDARLFNEMQGAIEFPIRISGDDLETQEKADAAVRGKL
ncbi:hypothetical protein LCGC14_0507480 [marine sediment metagenome]|uniref:Uncharacterized protein n=1 Tax=marine sediment metagenome TaxID=412755 RepID=A0A0F9S298_9ZZZZ